MKRNSILSLFVYGAVGLVFLMASYPVRAQDKDDIFEQYKKRAEEAFQKALDEQNTMFENYRAKINKEFSDYLEREWKKTTLYRALEKEPKPEPKPIFDDSPVLESRPLPFENPTLPPLPVDTLPPVVAPVPEETPEPVVVTPPAGTPEPVVEPVQPQEQPQPLEPIVIEEKQLSKTVTFTYLGNECKVRVPQNKSFHIRRGSKEELSKVWNALSCDAYNSILVDCLCLRKSLSLCDWAFFQLVQEFAAAYIGSQTSNDAVFLQTYVLTQLGYKARLAQQNGNLLLLLSFDGQIFSVPYIEAGGTKYYCFADNVQEGGMQLCDFSFNGERSGSLVFKSIPSVPKNNADSRVVKPGSNAVTVAVTPNKNLIDFYDRYPQCSCEILAAASLSREVKEQLYPPLKRAMANMSQAQAAGLLLDFVQTGFSYMTDPEQFGREKAFFGDELFYYPYCDCEDRSVLFSILVRDLLHLDVVLLDYPSHIATAVRFTENVTGDYFNIGGEKYLICDPTYIGAPIGKSMPDMLTKKASILTIK